jgi:putative ABC transport system permease protein
MSTRQLLRLLWRDRATTLVAAAVLALGIGASTAMFTVANATLLRPLPYPGAERLVTLRVISPEFRDRYPSFPANARHIDEWRRECRGCEELAAFKAFAALLTGAGEAEQVDGLRVTANAFSFFGVQPMIGRVFLPEEDRPGARRVVVISRALWARRFGSDPGAIGRTITLDGEAHEIVGVLPGDGRIVVPRALGALVRIPPVVDVFRPAAFTAPELESRGDFDYGAVVRMKPGVSIDVLRAELDALEIEVARRQQRAAPLTALVEPLHDVAFRGARGSLLVLMSATLGMLLIVCVNVTNLLVARQMKRRREAAIRIALGATRRQLLGETLAEGIAIAAAGGALGLAAAIALTRALAASSTFPLLAGVTADRHVVLAALAATVLAGVGVGILPALRAAASPPAETLKSGSTTTTDGRGGLRARRLLVGGQAALTAALLVVTALLLTSYVRLLNVDKGFSTSGVLTLDLSLPTTVYRTTDQQVQAIDAILDRLRALPGVTAVAVTNRLPLQGEAVVNSLSLENDTRPDAARPLANYRYVSPDYFTAMGTPLVQGRTFRDSDRGRQVVILSREAARLLWPSDDPIGRSVLTRGPGSASEVIGIAADTRAVDLKRADVPFVYLPYWLRAPASPSIAIRTTADPSASIGAARAAVWSIDRNIPVPRTRTMTDIVDAAVADRRLELTLMMSFGAAAALLASLGVYGVVSYAVTARAREMGIRTALGATPAQIRRMVIGEGMLPIATGTVAGLAASWPMGRAMSSLLFGVGAWDATAVAGAAAVLVIAALAACAAPASRAASSRSIVAALR